MKGLKLTGLAVVSLCATLVAGCGEVSRTGRSPVQIVILSLEAASGAEPDEFGGTLSSDVQTIVEREANGQTISVPTIFGDSARATLTLMLKDPGVPGASAGPSALNAVTINRYRVTYRRADGRNTPGVDVPFPFDSAVTFTIPAEGEVTAGFAIVRITAKQEAPLVGLVTSPVFIQTIAEVTFYGLDQVGNEISVTGAIGISFGNFGDPN